MFMHCVYCARLRGCVQLGSRRLRRSSNCIHLRASSTLEISRFAHSSRLGNSIALSLICILYSLHLFPSHTHMNTQTTHTHAHIYQRYTHPHNHKRHTHTHTHTLQPFSLVSVGRSLLKQGSLTKLKVTQWFGKAVRKKTNYLIVLSDYLLITKRVEK